jgi:hypothetical protein
MIVAHPDDLRGLDFAARKISFLDVDLGVGERGRAGDHESDDHVNAMRARGRGIRHGLSSSCGRSAR